jgi:group II intron reverse transcriptase/maturase
MPVEGRERRAARATSGKKSLSPSGIDFTTKVVALAERARRIRNEPLRTVAHLIDEEWLRESWKRLRKGAAYGIDAVSAEVFGKQLDANLEDLLERLRAGRYWPPPVRRVYIPKPGGRMRPLGLPTVEDKLAQRAVAILLSAVYEQDFLPMSYGFRSRRSAHQALEGVKAAIAQGKVSWVVDADIRSFFDEMDHDWLMKFVGHRIGDKAILRLISRWLKAGVMEDGKLVKASTGAPQGGVISPVLANIYLHYVIDLWFTKVVKKHLRGEMHGFRYADDTLFCFQFRRDAVRFLDALRRRLAKFGLSLNEEKTTHAVGQTSTQ